MGKGGEAKEWKTDPKGDGNVRLRSLRENAHELLERMEGLPVVELECHLVHAVEILRGITGL